MCVCVHTHTYAHVFGDSVLHWLWSQTNLGLYLWGLGGGGSRLHRPSAITWQRSVASLKLSCLIYKNGIIHRPLQGCCEIKWINASTWLTPCLARWQGLSNVGSLPSNLSLQTRAKLWEPHGLSLYLFASAFCPNLYFYCMSPCMWISDDDVCLCVCIYICLGMDTGIYRRCVYTLRILPGCAGGWVLGEWVQLNVCCVLHRRWGCWVSGTGGGLIRLFSFVYAKVV